MHISVTRRVLPVTVSAILLAGCQSSSELTRYSESIDACRLPDSGVLAPVVPGTVEIPADTVKAPETGVMPADRTTGDNELTTCRKVFARDLGGQKPNLNDYRSVTIGVARYTGSEDTVVGPKARSLMTDALGDHSGVRLVSGIGDEAGVTDRWAAVRSGNVVVVVSIVDGGSEIALIPPPNVDNVQRLLSSMADNLKRSYAS